MEHKPRSSFPYAIQSLLLWSFVPILWSFLAVYLQQKQLNPSQIGIVMAVNPFTAIFFQPLFGPMADRTGSKNRFFVIFAALAVLSLLLFPLGGSFCFIALGAYYLALRRIPTSPVNRL